MPGKVSKKSVNYRRARGKKRCGNCVMLNKDGSCDLVIGKIDKNDTCDRWEAKNGKR